ncbi:hypothetical protein CEK29_11065 [Bordetella genomosp. 5]|uniref:Uncharacterized protein n=1 Tax=Bordetella genomosp. 5 TaxID=1395608 RepID=A0A261TQZ2_9BORD|nr:hypothetical protein [Bordetella genomosp. 5]OZI43672.1 hypothetical protein CEK29_11065 [Bordetella genomosp. 5]OZI51865.1 hypothetical protein CAL25_10100 [Bordetella genomosp. 5]
MNSIFNVYLLPLVAFALLGVIWRMRSAARAAQANAPGGPAVKGNVVPDTPALALRDILMGGTLYLVLGPLAALATLALGASISNLNADAFTRILVAGVQTAYLFGGMPALCTGLLAGALRTSRWSWGRFGLTATAGMVGTMTLYLGNFHDRWPGDPIGPAFLLVGLPALLGTAIMTAVFYSRPWRMRRRG